MWNDCISTRQPKKTPPRPPMASSNSWPIRHIDMTCELGLSVPTRFNTVLHRLKALNILLQTDYLAYKPNREVEFGFKALGIVCSWRMESGAARQAGPW
jgi:hypothetical protein